MRWSFEIPSYSFDVTGSAVIKILEIVKNYSPKSKFFQPFSSNIFGNSKNSKQDEKEPFTPLSIYALGKVTAYYACEMYKNLYKMKIYGAIFYNHGLKLGQKNMLQEKLLKP